MFDTGSPISTINCNIATKGRIIKVEQKKTNSRGCKARVKSTGSGKKENMEPALKKDTLSQSLITEKIQELLPDFNGTSAPSLLQAKEAWKSKAGKKI